MEGHLVGIKHRVDGLLETHQFVLVTLQRASHGLQELGLQKYPFETTLQSESSHSPFRNLVSYLVSKGRNKNF